MRLAGHPTLTCNARHMTLTPEPPHPVPSTDEPEITEPAALVLSDGLTLNPAAKGWSRQPLLRANLRGRWGRNKRWDYLAILAGDYVISSVYADVDYLGLADLWWVHLPTGQTGGAGITAPMSRGISLPDTPGAEPLSARANSFSLDLSTDSDGGVEWTAKWTERDGRAGEFRAVMAQPPGHESLNVVIPWTNRQFQYTSKHQARPAHGMLHIGADLWRFGGDTGQPAWGVIDIGRGRWPYRTRWNWGGGAGPTRDGQHQLGLQLGGKWTEGTGFTENGLILDGKLIKLGREFEWEYDWRRPLRPWRVSDPGGWLDAKLVPQFDKHTKINAGVAATETHQVFGHWAGTARTETGATIEFAGMQGFAEESRSRW